MAKQGTTKYRSNKQEKKVAEELKGKVVIGSGALWGSKGDVRLDKYLIECKTTEKHNYSLKLPIWNKVVKEALKDGMRIPVMCIDLMNGKYRYAVINKDDFIIPKDFFNFFKENFVMTNSFTIRYTLYDCNVYICEKLAKEITIFPYPHLLVIPWNKFLELMEEQQ